MAEYDELIATAYRLIAQKGRAITVTRETPAPTSGQPWKSSGSTSQAFTTYGLRQDPRNAEKNFDFALKIVPNSTIERVDWHIYVPAQGAVFQPEPGDTVTWGVGTNYRVVTVSPVSPGEQDILYVLQVQV
jgi:hypothetical protein